MNKSNFKSLEALKMAIREGRKFASEGTAPKDPNEKPVPPESQKNVVDQADYNIPTDGVKNTNNLADARVVATVTPLDNTLTAEDPGIKAKEKPPVEETEKTVNLKGAAIIERLKKMATNIKDNVALDVSLAPDIISKVANIATETEKFNKNSNSQKIMAKDNFYKTASQIHKNVFDSNFSAIAQNPDISNLLKLAYAEGAQDAENTAASGELPPEVEAAPQTVAEEQNELMDIIAQLLQSGQITEEQANALAQIVGEAAMADGNEALSPEEQEAAIAQAIEQGLITPEQLQALAATQVNPEAVSDVASDTTETPTDNTDTIAKAASVKLAHCHDLARTVVNATMLIKHAAVEEGVIPESEAEVTVDDIDTILDAAQKSGEITPEEAAAAADIISDAIVEQQCCQGDAEEDDEEDEDDEEISDEDVTAIAEALNEQGVTPEELEAALQEVE